ncbi:MAG: hypothetical protein PHO08_06265 [Methylococcales bacterium]|nr:hypothetical protein [Methylococcales bacterium]
MDPNLERVVENIHHNNVPLMPFNFFTNITHSLFAGVLGFTHCASMIT